MKIYKNEFSLENPIERQVWVPQNSDYKLAIKVGDEALSSIQLFDGATEISADAAGYAGYKTYTRASGNPNSKLLTVKVGNSSLYLKENVVDSSTFEVGGEGGGSGAETDPVFTEWKSENFTEDGKIKADDLPEPDYVNVKPGAVLPNGNLFALDETYGMIFQQPANLQRTQNTFCYTFNSREPNSAFFKLGCGVNCTGKSGVIHQYNKFKIWGGSILPDEATNYTQFNNSSTVTNMELNQMGKRLTIDIDTNALSAETLNERIERVSPTFKKEILTQEEYDDLETKDEDTIYFVYEES